MHPKTLFRLAVAGVFLAAVPASAQQISGVVVASRTGEVLEGAHLALAPPDGGPAVTTISDAEGRFMLEVPAPGEWVIHGELIGYASIVSAPITVSRNERITVEIRFPVEAVALEPVVVSSRARVTPGLRGFQRRQAASERGGQGYFIDRADIERMGTSEPSQIFRNVVAVRVRPGARGHGEILRMANGCVPALYLDGVQINTFDPTTSLDDFVEADAVAAIEVYRSAWVEGYTDARSCGLVLVWTRKGSRPEADSPAPTWARLAAGTAVVAALLFFLH